MKALFKEVKCKQCKQLFKQYKSTQKVCSYDCAIKYAKNKRQTQEKKVWNKKKKVLKEKLETVTSLAVKAQKVFNTYIRLRDEGKPCISCKTPYKKNFQAGHYFSAGFHWSVRYNENNCFGQCIRCNMYLSGNLQQYSVNILERITPDQLEELSIKSQKTIKYSKEELINIRLLYQQKIKILKESKKK